MKAITVEATTMELPASINEFTKNEEEIQEFQDQEEIQEDWEEDQEDEKEWEETYLLEACDEDKFLDACDEGSTDIIDVMIDNGFDVNIQFSLKITPLGWVCQKTDPWVIDVVTKLITHGADVDMTDSSFQTALDYCLKTTPFQPHVAQLLLDCSKMGVNRLFCNDTNYLRSTRSVEAVKFLVKNGIDINNVTVNDEDDDDTIYGEFITPVDIFSVFNRPCAEYLISIGGKKYSEL